MKRLPSFIFAFVLIIATAFSGIVFADDFVRVRKADGASKFMLLYDISYSNKDTNGVEHNNIVSQIMRYDHEFGLYLISDEKMRCGYDTIAITPDLSIELIDGNSDKFLARASDKKHMFVDCGFNR